MVLYANEMKLCTFQGIKFLFFDQFKSVPHKIYDICCCEMRMSATSLTFWFIMLNCGMQARPPRAFPLFNVKFVLVGSSVQKSFVLVGPGRAGGPPSADRRGYNAACYYITEPRTEPSSGEKLPNSAEPNRT